MPSCAPILIINSALQRGSRREKERRDEGPTFNERAFWPAGWNWWLNEILVGKVEGLCKIANFFAYGNLNKQSYILRAKKTHTHPLILSVRNMYTSLYYFVTIRNNSYINNFSKYSTNKSLCLK